MICNCFFTALSETRCIDSHGTSDAERHTTRAANTLFCPSSIRDWKQNRTFQNGVGFGLSLFLYLSDKICPTGVPIYAELYPQLEVQTSCEVT